MHDLSPQSAVSSLNHWRVRGRVLTRYSRAAWLQCAVLLVIGLVVRGWSLKGQRIWDDQYLAFQNPFIKSPLLILESFRHYLFLESYSTHYRPIQTLSYLFDYCLWNTNAYGFHLTNILLHATSGVLLYLLARKLLASLWFHNVPLAVRDRVRKRLGGISLTAFLIALLWSVHPVHSAAIDYISGRADSLAFVFAAGGWLLVFRGRTGKGMASRWFFFGMAAASGLVALLSREIACIWFALFLGH